VLITSSISDEGKSLLSAMIAKTFVTMEKRALIIDMSPQGAAGRGRPTSRPLEEILNGIELGLPPPFEPMRRQRLTMLHRSTGIDVSQRLVTSPVFAKLLAAARDSYDLVLIEAPPVMLCADALYLGRFADLVLHVVRWNSTPRAAVAAAIRRMRHVDIRVEGVILSRVDHQEYLRCNGVDPQDYFRQHGATRALLPSRESMSQDEKAPAA
jgi:Mrp family chromosome partitioning ATPase